MRHNRRLSRMKFKRITYLGNSHDDEMMAFVYLLCVKCRVIERGSGFGGRCYGLDVFVMMGDGRCSALFDALMV